MKFKYATLICGLLTLSCNVNAEKPDYLLAYLLSVDTIKKEISNSNEYKSKLVKFKKYVNEFNTADRIMFRYGDELIKITTENYCDGYKRLQYINKTIQNDPVIASNYKTVEIMEFETKETLYKAIVDSYVTAYNNPNICKK